MIKNWNRWDYYFKLSGEKYGVDWQWLKAIAMNESSLGSNKSVEIGLINPKNVAGSTSSDGRSWGLMQMTLSTARAIDPSVTAQKLNIPEYSIEIAAQYVADLKKMFNSNDPRFNEWVCKSFNQGPGNTRKEADGKIQGYAAEYWRRFKNNLEIVSAYL